MSEVDQVASGQVEGSSGTESNQDQTQQSKEDKVAYETYRRTLSEAKKAKQSAAELASELEKYKQSELETKGKQSELIDSLRKQLAEKDQAARKFKEDFAFQSLKTAAIAEGAKHGCVDYDLLLKAMDLSSVEVQDDFTINPDDLSRVVNDVVTKKPFLFKKQITAPKDVIPSSKVDTKEKPMSLQDKIKKLAEISAGGGIKNFKQ